MEPESTRANVRARAESGPASTQTTQLLTANDVLYDNELQRGKLWVVVSGHLAAIGIGSAAFIDTPGSLARLLLAGGCGALLIASLVGWRILSKRDRYSANEAALFNYFSLSVVLPAYYFFGWFSPVLVVVCFGGVIFAMGHTTRAVIAVAIATSGSHLVVSGLTIGGVLPDVGVSALRVEDTTRAILVLAGTQALFGLAFVIGRQLRVHSLDGVERYGQAVRESTRREVLLQEAIDELHRARRVGDPGRFTGVELGSFRLGVVLGRGGMGEVYEATHVSSSEPAAVKVLTPSARGERAVRRFEREIELVAALDSPHIVRVFEHSAAGEAMPYLAMERLQGNTLAEALRGRLGERATLQMILEVAEAVDTAHDAGVIHRDLKPQNIFHHLGAGENIWKVLDFGVSKISGASSSLTGAGMVGTPSYMSPEQASGNPVEARSDLFTLGCIAYRCLTGRRAFSGADMAEVLRQVIQDMPVRPSIAALLPLEVDLVLAVALAKDPRDRFGTAYELSVALDEACRAHIEPHLASRARALVRESPWADEDF